MEAAISQVVGVITLMAGAFIAGITYGIAWKRDVSKTGEQEHEG